jgi:hypothetical protein
MRRPHVQGRAKSENQMHSWRNQRLEKLSIVHARVRGFLSFRLLPPNSVSRDVSARIHWVGHKSETLGHETNRKK